MYATVSHLRSLLLGAGVLFMACGDDDLDATDGSGTLGSTSSSTGSGTGSSTSDSTTASTTGTSTSGTTSADATTAESESSSGSDSSGASESSSTGGGVCAGQAWEAPDWEDNAEDALALRQALAALSTAFRDAETSADGAPSSVEDLEALWTEGDPSLETITSPTYADVVADAFEEFIEVVDAGPQVLVDGAGEWSPGDNGGIFGDVEEFRGINEGGLELRQIVDKGVFSGGSFYRHALSLTESELTAATIDSIAALWGANVGLDPEADPGLDDAAGYGYGMGFFAEMAGHLAMAKSLVGVDECTAELDASLVSFFRLWEQSMYARFVYYVEVGRAEAETGATDNEILAHALHAVGEGVGLAAGFYGLEDPSEGPLADAGRIVTDAAIEEMMTALRVDLSDLGASTMGTFIGNPGDFETGRDEVEAAIAEALDLDGDVVEGWRSPTAG